MRDKISIKFAMDALIIHRFWLKQQMEKYELTYRNYISFSYIDMFTLFGWKLK